MQIVRARLRKDGRYEARAQIEPGLRLSGYGKSEKEAIADLERKASLMLLSARPQAAKPNLHSYWEQVYLPTVEHRSQGWKNQIAWAKSHCKPLLHLQLDEITRAQLQILVNRLKLSPESVRHVRKVLHAVFNLAEIDGVIPTNPARHLKLPRRIEKPKPILTAKELAQLFGKSEGFAGQPFTRGKFQRTASNGCIQLFRATQQELKWAIWKNQGAELGFNAPLHPKYVERLIERAVKAACTIR